MASAQCISSPNDPFLRHSLFLSSPPMLSRSLDFSTKEFAVFASISCSPSRPVRSVQLDKHVVRENSILFVLKLTTLIQSHPRHTVELHILNKYRSFLALSDKTCSVHSMILRYPSVFQLIRARGEAYSRSQLCVCFTPAASALVARQYDLQVANSISLAAKVQKLLMLSSHRRILLSKLVVIAPDLGLPPNFSSLLCYRHPNKFKTIDTSYGKAIELIEWEPKLAISMALPDGSSNGLIVDRPLKFKQPRLRKGFNVKRRHHEFLMRFREQQELCPYKTAASDFPKQSAQSESRACSVVREVLGMTIGKRTLMDHLAIFRKEFGLPTKLRAMILRHPELFYVSCKGLRDSVFLLECFDDRGKLIDKDESLSIQDQLLNLVGRSKNKQQSNRSPVVSHVDRINGVLYNDGLDNVIVSEASCVNAFDDANGFDKSCPLKTELREAW